MSVRVERQGRVLTVIHSRPEARNAVDAEHADALNEAFLSFDADPEADVAVFWGEGGAFCAGAPPKALAPPRPGLDQPARVSSGRWRDPARSDGTHAPSPWQAG